LGYEDGRFISPHPAFEGRKVGQRYQSEILDVSDSELGDFKGFNSGDDHIDVCDDVGDDDDDEEINASATEE
jgi:hypothetical protein